LRCCLIILNRTWFRILPWQEEGDGLLVQLDNAPVGRATSDGAIAAHWFSQHVFAGAPALAASPEPEAAAAPGEQLFQFRNRIEDQALYAWIAPRSLSTYAVENRPLSSVSRH